MALRNILRYSALAAFIVALSAPAFAQRNWQYLGEANIDGNADHDKIKVNDRAGLFRAIRFEVERGAVNFDRVVAHFENGEDDRLPLNQVVPPGKTTRRLDLRGNQRKLDSVEVWYHRGGWNRGDKPKIRLFGIRH